MPKEIPQEITLEENEALRLENCAIKIQMVSKELDGLITRGNRLKAAIGERLGVVLDEYDLDLTTGHGRRKEKHGNP